MKKFTFSVAAVMAMSAFAIAGGDIAPVEEPVVVVESVVDDSSFYLGLAYGLGSMDWSSDNPDYNMDFDANTIMLQAGYNFNKYIAVEGRYWFGMDTSNVWTADENTNFDLALDAWGIYVKPQYPVTEAFNIYALLGYANVSKAEYTSEFGKTGDLQTIDGLNVDADGFSWGLGASYAFTDNLAVFLDYVSIYNDTVYEGEGYLDWDVNTWNFGVTYKF